MSTDPLFMRNQDGEYFWYHNDHLGTPQMMTTSSGAVVWKAKYSSFGKATVDSASTVENPLRFPGQYEDAETGLHYNWFRYYNADAGRYIVVDPIGLEGGNNLYIYCYGDPLNWFDIDGEQGQRGNRRVRTTDGGTTADEKADGIRNKQKRENNKKLPPKKKKDKKQKKLKKKKKKGLGRGFDTFTAHCTSDPEDCAALLEALDGPKCNK